MKKQLLYLCLCLTMAIPLFSMDLTVEESVDIALEQNLDLQSSYIGQRTKERTKNSAWNEFLPEATAGAALWRSNTLDSGATEYWNLTADINVSLGISGSTWFRIRSTILDYQGGLISLEMAETQLTRDVRKNFYYIILLREKIALTENMIDTAYQRYERAKVNYEIGNIPYVEVLSYQVAWENMKPDLINQINAFDTARWEFKRLLGIALEEDITLIGEIESDIREFDPETLISEFVYDRLEIQRISQLILQLKNNRNLAVTGTMTPVVGLGYTWTPTLNDPFENLSGDPTWLDPNGAFTMSLTLPLDGFVPNSKKNLEVKKLNDQLDQADLKLENAIRGNTIDIQSVVLSLNKSAGTIESLELNVDLAQENYNLVYGSYEEGIMDYLDVQNADDELNKAKLQVLNEKYNYISSLMDLLYITNQETMD